MRSKKQWRGMFAKQGRGELPKGTAREMAESSPPFRALPERVGDKHGKRAKKKHGAREPRERPVTLAKRLSNASGRARASARHGGTHRPVHHERRPPVNPIVTHRRPARVGGKSEQQWPIINSGDHDWTQNLFLMWAGAYGDTRGYVWANSFEDAFEHWVEYLDERAPGLLTNLDEGDLRESARDLGIEWQADWPDHEDRKFQRVVEHAEVDLTPIGHTTLEHGAYIPSHEWGGDEITGAELHRVKARSIAEQETDEE